MSGRCTWYYGWDGYVSCGVHLWTGMRYERVRMDRRLVCPTSFPKHSAARSAAHVLKSGGDDRIRTDE